MGDAFGVNTSKKTDVGLLLIIACMHHCDRDGAAYDKQKSNKGET